MIVLRLNVDVSEDRRVVFTLPPDVPTGKTELIVTLKPEAASRKKSRASLSQWADENAEALGAQISSEDVESFTGRRN